ncbi:hypothetical protein C3L33_19884, partial [Rhododendron williamsianum]
MGIRLPGIFQAKQVIGRVFSTSMALDVPKGHLAVYVGENEKKRFVVPIEYLRHPLFQKLLSKAEEEFGFDHPMGGLTIPCREETFIDVTCSLKAEQRDQNPNPCTALTDLLAAVPSSPESDIPASLSTPSATRNDGYDGTDTSQGKAQLVSNINACMAVADVVRTTLGPRGMDKLIHDEKGNTTISNDGATIMKLLDIVHPAAKILVDIAKSQDSECGSVAFMLLSFTVDANSILVLWEFDTLAAVDELGILEISSSRVLDWENTFCFKVASRVGDNCLEFYASKLRLFGTCEKEEKRRERAGMEVGDGTTTVVLLAGEFLKEAKPFIEDGVHPQNLIRSFRTAAYLAIEKVKELANSIEGKSLQEKKRLLANCAATTLSSKLIGGEKEFFATMVVDAVLAIGSDDRLNMIGIKKVPGGNMRDSFLVNGVAFKKTFSYAGFEQQPKKFVMPKILLLNIELELKSEKENAEIRLSDPSQYQSIVDAEWNIIYDKLDKCVKSGAKIVLSRLAIGDLGTQIEIYFVRVELLKRICNELQLQRVEQYRHLLITLLMRFSSLYLMVLENEETQPSGTLAVLGSCELFEERQVGNERFNIFSGCPSGQTATIVLRGGADQFIEEAERSLHDAIMIVRRAMKNSTVVAGGGAIDMEISRYLRQHARTIAGKSQLFINSYAKALEVIPRQLCDNAGFDATDVLNKLRQKHALHTGEGAPYGVDINTGGIADNYANFVWEPAVVKINAINAATEAACLVLSVDETVKNPKFPSSSPCFSLVAYSSPKEVMVVGMVSRTYAISSLTRLSRTAESKAERHSESAQGDAAAMGGRGRGGAAFRGRGGRGMRRR